MLGDCAKGRAATFSLAVPGVQRRICAHRSHRHCDLVVASRAIDARGVCTAAVCGTRNYVPAIMLATLYGAEQTAFPEELLFRGLIAGSLWRRFSVGWANLLQAVIFLLPHFLILLVMPEM